MKIKGVHPNETRIAHSNQEDAVEQYLQSVLLIQDVERGTNGQCSVEIRFNGDMLLRIRNLTPEKAKELFDIIDENNSVGTNLTLHQLDGNGEEVDMNVLPNIFSE